MPPKDSDNYVAWLESKYDERQRRTDVEVGFFCAGVLAGLILANITFFVK